MSESTTFRGALIGTGFFSRNHLHAWAGLPGAEIVAVCDLDEDKACAAAAEVGDPVVFTDAARMFEVLDPDFVDIATTVDSHRPLVELACRKGRLVICQKPFAETLADADAMVQKAAVTGTQLLVHENFRWEKAFVDMAALVAAGRIGTPHFARFSFRHRFDVYRTQPYLAEIERYAIMDVGLHVFDLARRFMGEVQRVSCHTQRLNLNVRGEDAFTALLTHTSGAASVIEVSFFSTYDPEPFPETLAVLEGDSGTLELTRGYRLILHSKGVHEVLDAEPAIPPWGAAPWHMVQDSVIRLQQHAIEVMRGAAEPQPSGADNLRTLSLAMAAYEAAEHGRIVSLVSL